MSTRQSGVEDEAGAKVCSSPPNACISAASCGSTHRALAGPAALFLQRLPAREFCRHQCLDFLESLAVDPPLIGPLAVVVRGTHPSSEVRLLLFESFDFPRQGFQFPLHLEAQTSRAASVSRQGFLAGAGFAPAAPVLPRAGCAVSASRCSRPHTRATPRRLPRRWSA